MARFFFKTETEKNILSCLCTWGVAKVGLVVLFCRSDALSGFYGLSKIYFPFEIIFSCRLLLSLRFFPGCSGFMNTNCVAVFVVCFLALVSALLFYRFCAFFLPFLCLALAFILKGFPLGALCFPLCCNFFFLPLLFAKFMCSCVHVCRSTFGVFLCSFRFVASLALLLLLLLVFVGP